MKPPDPAATDRIELSEQLERIRRLVIPEDINTLLAEHNFLKLAQRMSEIARAANTCSGICFTFFISEKSIEQKPKIHTESQERSQNQ